MSDKRRLLKLSDNPVAADDDDTEDLESLLGDEEDEEEEPSVEEQLAEMRKSQGFQAKIMLSLTRSMSALAKHVMALQSDEDEDEFEATTSTPDSEEDVMEKQESATESSFSPYGSSDMGEPETLHGGDTSEKDALSAASEERAESDPGLVSLQRKGGSRKTSKSKVSKDDASSNFGQKDSDIPGNPPVTPDTKDWPVDQTVIPHSGLSPSLQKLQKQVSELTESLAAAGIIKKAQSRGVGTRVGEPQPDLQAMEERARGMSFKELNRWRTESGEIPAGIV